MTKRPVFINGMHGLGDNLYQRAVLREYNVSGSVFLETSWPQLYTDLPHIKPVRSAAMRLRTQAKNAASASGFYPAPQGVPPRTWNYVRQGGTILQGLEESLGVRLRAPNMAGPPVAPHAKIPADPYVVVRPATIRTEWRADSRNPNPEYIAEAAAAARSTGLKVISVADLQPGAEWALDPLPVADETYHAGELSILELLALVAGASGLIGGVGWIVPAAIAYRVPLLLIFGGWGLHNGPGRIFDPRIDTSNVVQAVPDEFCMCAKNNHPCNKTITQLERYTDEFLSCIV